MPEKYITIYSISNSSHQNWQADLLDYSFVKSKMPGSIYRLVSKDPYSNYLDANKFKLSTLMYFPDYSKINERIYLPINKAGSLRDFLKIVNLTDDTILIFLDPDMIFTKTWLPIPDYGEVIGQNWYGYSQEFCLRSQNFCPEKGVMYPFAMRVKDAKKIVDDFYEFCKNEDKSENPTDSEKWMLDMSALVAAITKNKLNMTLHESIGLCNNWDNSNDDKAPILHYCQPIKNLKNEQIWSKQNWTPGDKIPNYNETLNRVDKEVLKILQEIF